MWVFFPCLNICEWCELQTVSDSSKQPLPPDAKHSRGRYRTAAIWSHRTHWTVLLHLCTSTFFKCWMSFVQFSDGEQHYLDQSSSNNCKGQRFNPTESMRNPVTAAVGVPFSQFYLFKILVGFLEHVGKTLNVGSYACMILISWPWYYSDLENSTCFLFVMLQAHPTRQNSLTITNVFSLTVSLYSENIYCILFFF